MVAAKRPGFERAGTSVHVRGGVLLTKVHALLNQIQWHGFQLDITTPNPACPSCYEDVPDGHAPDCELAALLEETKPA